ncbi:MAG: hypothetical protein LRZ94_00070 [Candidatus Pacebacteria bacterium]|nr:hypothetical protein [Candidatus Paceibacterota bacterium]
MSFYQEYLKKQQKKGSSAPIDDVGNKKEVDISITKGSTLENVNRELDVFPPLEGVDSLEIKKEATPLFSQKAKEEKERREFLKRINGEDHQIPTEDSNKKEKRESRSISISPNPYKKEKILIRIMIIVIFVLSALVAFLVIYQMIRRDPVTDIASEVIKNDETKEPPIITEAQPISFFAENTGQDPIIIEINNFSQSTLEQIRLNAEEGSLSSLVLKTESEEGLVPVSIELLLGSLNLNLPLEFNNRVDRETFGLFAYLFEERVDLIFIAKVIESEGFLEVMRGWEYDTREYLSEFILLLGRNPEILVEEFIPSIQDRDIVRCQEYVDENKICYSLVQREDSNLFILATSQRAIKHSLNNLK